jgi:uncharacterized protein YdaU (DUF1376 family)
MSAAPDIWMAFYVGDYVKNTMQLTTQQHGAYMLLIMSCWQQGGAVDGDDESLASITKLSMRDWLRERPKLAPFFEVTPQRWSHRRVVHERAAAEEHTQRRSRAGTVAAGKRWQDKRNANRMPDAMPDPMRNDDLHHHLHSHNHSHPMRVAQSWSEDWQPEPATCALRQERPDARAAHGACATSATGRARAVPATTSPPPGARSCGARMHRRSRRRGATAPLRQPSIASASAWLALKASGRSA